MLSFNVIVGPQNPNNMIFAVLSGCRYFVVPFILVALHMPCPSRLQMFLLGSIYVAVNAATLYIFSSRPFLWPDGSIARFVW